MTAKPNPGRRTTKAEAREGLAVALTQTLRLAQKRFSYIDTLGLLLKAPLDASDLRRLRAMLGRRLKLWPSKSRQYPLGIRIQQPSAEIIASLATCLPDHCVSRVDIAFDLTTGTQAGAAEIKAFFDQHLFQRWHGKRKRGHCETTVYFGSAGTNRNIALYANRKSKKVDAWAAHLEIRLKGSRTCKTYGLFGIEDVIGLDHLAALDRNCRVFTIAWSAFDKVVDDIVTKSLQMQGWPTYGISSTVSARERVTKRIWSNVARRKQDDEHTPSTDELKALPVQEWAELMRHHERWLVGVPVSTFLSAVPEIQTAVGAAAN